MKRVFSVMLVFLIFLLTVGYSVGLTPALSYTEYRRVIDDKTGFYGSVMDAIPLFYLPYTYYVKVLGEAGEFTHVEIHGEGGRAALDGYVYADRLFKDNLLVSSPFLVQNLTTVDTAVLYQDVELSVAVQYLFPERPLVYYGENVSHSGKIYYVGYNSKLGYVKESDVYPFKIQPHPNELTFLTPEKPVVSPLPESDGEGFYGLKVVIIVCLVFAGIIGLFIALGKKSYIQQTSNYYDENEYE